MDQDEVSERCRPPLAPFTRRGHSPLRGHEVARPAVASLSPSPRGRDQESTEGSGTAASAHLLGVGVPVIPQARVGQHEPVLLPLPAGRAGGGRGKDRRETDRRLPREAQEQGGTCCSATSQPLPPSLVPFQLPLTPLGSELGFPTAGETETGGEGKKHCSHGDHDQQGWGKRQDPGGAYLSWLVQDGHPSLLEIEEIWLEERGESRGLLRAGRDGIRVPRGGRRSGKSPARLLGNAWGFRTQWRRRTGFSSQQQAIIPVRGNRR